MPTSCAHEGRGRAAPRPRDRAATEERILAAVGEVLARDGFGALGVNAIAREAGVDKVLIYRYFGGLPELLRSLGRQRPLLADRGRSCWATIRRPLLALPLAERYALFFDRFIDALRRRPLTLEILAAEIVERNELTAILEAEREQWGAQAEALFGGADFERAPQLRGITLLLVAGVQYLLVRSRKIRIFGGIDLRSDAGWDDAQGRGGRHGAADAGRGHGSAAAAQRALSAVATLRHAGRCAGP